jgi:hypothetical protein
MVPIKIEGAETPIPISTDETLRAMSNAKKQYKPRHYDIGKKNCASGVETSPFSILSSTLPTRKTLPPFIYGNDGGPHGYGTKICSNGGIAKLFDEL